MSSTQSDILDYNVGYTLRANLRKLVSFLKEGNVLACKNETYKKKFYEISLHKAAVKRIDKKADAIIIEY